MRDFQTDHGQRSEGRPRRVSPLRYLSLLMLSALAGCAMDTEQKITEVPAVAQVRPTLPADAPPAEYVVSVGDELDIKFTDQPYLSETVKVRPDGNISLQLVGALRAEGLSAEKLQQEITKRYRALSPAGLAAPGPKRYVIGVGDELELKFPYHKDYDELVRVRPDGRISLRLVRSVMAEGKTPDELEDELNRLYGAYLRKPQLALIMRSFAQDRVYVGDRAVRAGLENVQPTVIVRSYAPREIFIGGEVLRPGVLPHRGRMSLLSAVIEAGGVKGSAQTSTVMILRRTGPTQAVIIQRNLNPDLQGAGTNDIYLEPFDIVLVPKHTIAEIGEAMEQVFNMLTPLKNSSFGLVYQINEISSVDGR